MFVVSRRRETVRHQASHSSLLNDDPRQPGESVLLGYGEAQVSAEPSGIPSPGRPDFGDQSLLSSKQYLDATGNLDRLLTLPNGNRRGGPRSCSMMAFAFWVSCSFSCRVKQ